MKSESPIPSPQLFYLDAALYQKFELNSENFLDALTIQYFRGPLDAFCVACETVSVFWSSGRPLRNQDGPVDVGQLSSGNVMVESSSLERDVPASELEPEVRTNRYFTNHFTCARVKDHAMQFNVAVTPTSICKFGQIPSLADLQDHRIRKYRKLLGKEKWIEFSKAIGLKAHGVGIGGFVYLRAFLRQ